MDDMIGTVVDPAATLYIRIGRIGARKKSKRGDRETVFTKQIGVPLHYILRYLLSRRVCSRPLIGVARSNHLLSSLLNKFHHEREVVHHSFADGTFVSQDYSTFVCHKKSSSIGSAMQKYKEISNIKPWKRLNVIQKVRSREADERKSMKNSTQNNCE